LKAFDYTGPFAYSLTINTNDSRSYFIDDRFIRFCIVTLHERASLAGFEVLAYCFMPNHLHLLVKGLSGASRLRPFVQQFKQLTGFAFKTEHGNSLWHRSFYDHAIRRDDDLHSIAAYIWANPVQAGLVERVEDYPYSGPAERLSGPPERLGVVRGAVRGRGVGGQSLSSVRTNDPAAVERERR
jgi:putative transposase